MKWREERPWVIMSGVATLVAALATLMIAFSTREQVQLAKSSLEESKKASDATRETLEESIESNKADTRAWVTVSNLRIDPLEAGKENRLTLSITNSGRTPALDVRFRMQTSIMDRKCDPPTLKPDAGTQGTAVVAAGQTNSMSELFTLKAEVIGQILGNKRWIMTRCEVIYKDIFELPHETHVLSFYNPKTKTFQWCPEGNVSN